MDIERLVQLFYHLIAINAVSRQERPVADFIRLCLEDLDIEVYEDLAGRQVGGNSGNLIAKVSGSLDLPPIGLTAHMDTIKPTKGIHPSLVDGKIVSDGTTILGADNRAGVAIILYIIENLKKNGTAHRPFEAIFTIGEETGLFGALHLDITSIDSKDLYVLDSSADPGCFVHQAPHALEFHAKLVGKSSHAAVRPEAGVSAISMAGELLRSIPTGQVDECTTINFGTIKGGEANNVIAPLAELTGEIRSFDKRRIDHYYQQLVNSARCIAEQYGGECQLSSQEAFPGFDLDLESTAVKRLRKAMSIVNMPFEPLRYHGASDANVLNVRGFTAIDLGIGAKNPHAYDEYIKLDDMKQMVTLVEELLIRSNN